MIFQLTENVFVQDSDLLAGQAKPWVGTPATFAMRPSAIAHVIQFFDGGDVERQAQGMTAKSVCRACRHTRNSVQPLAAMLAGDPMPVPEGFISTAPLRRTIRDVKAFGVPRPLPLLFDILGAAAEVADPAGFLIYTNSDICVSRGFYDSIHALLAAGFDCVIVNRRTVGSIASFGGHPELAELEAGDKHPGLDCFVFPVAWMKSFVKSEACIGMGMVMRSLLYNLVAHADKMLIMKDAHLTFHYGDDRSWNSPAYADYEAHNVACATEVIRKLCENVGYRERLRAFCSANNEVLRPADGPA